MIKQFFDLNRSVIAEFYGVQRKIPMDEVLSNESEILGNHESKHIIPI